MKEEFTMAEWIEAGITTWDKKAEYVEHVKPLAEAFLAECTARGFPVVLYACHSQTLEGNGGHQAMHLPDDVSLTPAEVLLPHFVQQTGHEGVQRLIALSIADARRQEKGEASREQYH